MPLPRLPHDVLAVAETVASQFFGLQHQCGLASKKARHIRISVEHEGATAMTYKQAAREILDLPLSELQFVPVDLFVSAFKAVWPERAEEIRKECERKKQLRTKL